MSLPTTVIVPRTDSLISLLDALGNKSLPTMDTDAILGVLFDIVGECSTIQDLNEQCMDFAFFDMMDDNLGLEQDDVNVIFGWLIQVTTEYWEELVELFGRPPIAFNMTYNYGGLSENGVLLRLSETYMLG